ncbi:hypothetical protein VPH35_083841 [Triticum aestivum]|uniref:uncharacterized protein n=1 Tax=Triticum aestivum TaxID=4565 RepID=UPI001D01B65F|nr:uncharacterized protein LOC123104118 [Triticum aestivum]
MPEQIPSSFSSLGEATANPLLFLSPGEVTTQLARGWSCNVFLATRRQLQPWIGELQTMLRRVASGVYGSPDCYGELQPWIAGSWNRHPKELQPASLGAADDERRLASGYGGGAAMERTTQVLRAGTGARRSCGHRHRSCGRRHGKLQVRDTLLHARNWRETQESDNGEGRRPAARGGDRRDESGGASRAGASFVHGAMGMFPREEDTGEEGKRSGGSNFLNRTVLM